MKKLSILLPAAALLVCAGCAQTRSTAMGGSPSSPSASGSTATAASSGPRLVCRDGRWTDPGGSCANHGGTERVLGTQ